jgi:restriction system protein
MTVWVIKGGEFGEREQRMLDHDLISCSWDKIKDMSHYNDRQEIQLAYREAYPHSEDKKVASHVGQLYAFRHSVSTGDLVVLPLKKTGALAIGLITGEYAYRTDLEPDFTHTRAVKWISKNVPRTKFDQDLLYTFGSFLGFCRAERNNAEERIRRVLTSIPEVERLENADQL